MKTTTMKTMFLSLILTMTSLMSFSQMNYWTLPENYVNMTTQGATPISGGFGDPYIAANGAYDHNGFLLFYVKCESTGVSVIDPAGNPIYLDDVTYTCNTPNAIAEVPLQEIAIVPVPGACKQYYVIWIATGQALSGMVLAYAVIDCNSGVSVLTNSTVVKCWAGNSSGLAVTQSSGGTRYVLVLERDQLVRYTITATGISINTMMTLADDSAPFVSCFTNSDVTSFLNLK